jgi:hypothetical protein
MRFSLLLKIKMFAAAKAATGATGAAAGRVQAEDQAQAAPHRPGRVSVSAELA